MALPNPGMVFTAFDPLPAASLNDIVENVEALAAGTGLNDSIITASKIDFTTGIWWKEIGRSTLTVAGDTMTVSSLPSYKYIKIMTQATGTDGLGMKLRFNNDSGNNYSFTQSIKFGAATDSISQSGIDIVGTVSSHPLFGTAEIVNISGFNKRVIATATNDGGSGASAVPSAPRYTYGKWESTNVANSISIVNTGNGDYAIGSELVVLGHN